MLVTILVSLAVGFVVGILVGRNNKDEVEAGVKGVKEVAKDVKEGVDKLK